MSVFLVSIKDTHFSYFDMASTYRITRSPVRRFKFTSCVRISLPLTKPDGGSLELSFCILALGLGTGCKLSGDRLAGSVLLRGAGVGRGSLSCPCCRLTFSWISVGGLVGTGGLGGIFKQNPELEVEVGTSFFGWG